ncbi:MAG: SAM-dependent methyltransferase [Mycoplasma sp.]|nr:SAM-dependent methyltransferase [Candidatus Hennigella equi]
MNRIKQISNLIEKCQCVYDVGSDHALLAINILRDKKAKQVVNIEKNWLPHNAGKTNLAKNHLTTKTLNVLNDGLVDITKKVFIQPNYIVIAGMGANNIVNILEKKDPKINRNAIYLLEPNCDVDVLRRYLAKAKYDVVYENVCLDRTKFYQIICAKQGTKIRKISTYEAYFGLSEKQIDKKIWMLYLKACKQKIEKKKLYKFSHAYAVLYDWLKKRVKK